MVHIVVNVYSTASSHSLLILSGCSDDTVEMGRVSIGSSLEDTQAKQGLDQVPHLGWSGSQASVLRTSALSSQQAASRRVDQLPRGGSYGRERWLMWSETVAQ